MENLNLQQEIIDTIENAKGSDITLLDVKGKSDLTDEFIITTGTSTRHVLSITEKIIDKAKELGLTYFGSKAVKESDWLVVDLGSIIVHVMTAESRERYALEKLWG